MILVRNILDKGNKQILTGENFLCKTILEDFRKIQIVPPSSCSKRGVPLFSDMVRSGNAINFINKSEKRIMCQESVSYCLAHSFILVGTNMFLVGSTNLIS